MDLFRRVDISKTESSTFQCVVAGAPLRTGMLVGRYAGRVYPAASLVAHTDRRGRRWTKVVASRPVGVAIGVVESERDGTVWIQISGPAFIPVTP